jgi:hypothetical protein
MHSFVQFLGRELGHAPGLPPIKNTPQKGRMQTNNEIGFWALLQGSKAFQSTFGYHVQFERLQWFIPIVGNAFPIGVPNRIVILDNPRKVDAREFVTTLGKAPSAIAIESDRFPPSLVSLWNGPLTCSTQAVRCNARNLGRRVILLETSSAKPDVRNTTCSILYVAYCRAL